MKKKILSVLLAFAMLGTPAMFNESADTPLSITAEAASYKKLAKPTNVKAKVSDGKITLSWKKVSGAEAYGIYKYDAKKEKYVKVKNITKNKITISVSKAGTYKFRIYSLDKVDGKYKKGKYASKTVKVYDDIFAKEFAGIKFGMTPKQVINEIKGSTYIHQDDTILKVIDGKDEELAEEFAVYYFKDNRLVYYGFAYVDSDGKFEECCNYFENNGWDTALDNFGGFSSSDIYYGASMYEKDGQHAMVIEMEELGLVFSVIFDVTQAKNL